MVSPGGLIKNGVPAGPSKMAVLDPANLTTHIRPPDQYVQPYEFGYPESKKTGLWLKNLPLLIPSKIVEPEWVITADGKRHSPSHARITCAKIRSLTYQGIADAMAEQWGGNYKSSSPGVEIKQQEMFG